MVPRWFWISFVFLVLVIVALAMLPDAFRYARRWVCRRRGRRFKKQQQEDDDYFGVRRDSEAIAKIESSSDEWWKIGDEPPYS